MALPIANNTSFWVQFVDTCLHFIRLCIVLYKFIVYVTLKYIISHYFFIASVAPRTRKFLGRMSMTIKGNVVHMLKMGETTVLFCSTSSSTTKISMWTTYKKCYTIVSLKQWGFTGKKWSNFVFEIQMKRCEDIPQLTTTKSLPSSISKNLVRGWVILW